MCQAATSSPVAGREADARALVAGRDADVRRLGERADDRDVVRRQRPQAGVDAQRAGVVEDREEAGGAAGDRARDAELDLAVEARRAGGWSRAARCRDGVDSTTIAICSAASSASTAAT